MRQTERKVDTMALPARSRGDVITLRAAPPSGASRWKRFLIRVVVLLLLWAILTDFRPDALIFGGPAALAGAALAFVMPANRGWRFSPLGALGFVPWFAAQSVRGAIDVAWRAFAPQMPLRPGFRRHPLTLPPGAPRVLFLNAVTLLPGTLSAEVTGDAVIVHMLDTRTDLEADLTALEARVASLFALS